MYTHFFRFREPPFSITPDPAFLYLSPRHHEALAHLLYGTGESGGFVQLTGEVGTGKTTVIRTLLEQRMPEVDVALILNPRQTVAEFLQSICDELGVSYAGAASLKALVDALNQHLLTTHAQSRRTVLIIDEAQNLSEDLLEQVRLLTNLETSKQKLLRIMLIGQPELDELLARPTLRQLAQRITARFHLTALSREESTEYIAHRLRVVGGDAALFDAAAMRAVYRHSDGVPRLINVLCDRALLAAYGANETQVSAARVNEAAHGLGHGRRYAQKQEIPWRRGVPWVPGIALAGVLAVAWWWSHDSASLPTSGESLARENNAPAEVRADPSADESAPANPASSVTSEGGQRAASTLADSAQMTEASASSPAGAAPGSGPAAAPATPSANLGDASSIDPLPLTPRMPHVASTADMLAAVPGLGEQVAILLGQWDETLRIDADQPVCTAIGAVQLRCLRERSDWSTLRRFDRPAILTLIDAKGVRRYALLRHIYAAHAEIVVDDRFVLVPLAELDALWNGEFLIFWRDRSPGGIIRPGDSGDAVRWLRTALARIEQRPLITEPEANFDAELRAHVEAFQRSRELSVDGHVGEKTRLMLMQALYPEDGPRLLVREG